MTALFLLLASTAHAGDICSGIKFKDDPFGGGSTATEVVQGLSQFTAASVVTFGAGIPAPGASNTTVLSTTAIEVKVTPDAAATLGRHFCGSLRLCFCRA